MSGGSLDYICYKVDDVAGRIKRDSERPLHLAFAKHLELVAIALHDLEWVWSSDMSRGDEDEAIEKVLAPGDELSAATDLANEALEHLKNALKKSGDKNATGHDTR